MNPLESQLEYPFHDTMPESGAAFEVAPGVFWLRMKLPFALDHINLWLLADDMESPDGRRQQGWTIVDCGISNEATRAAWEDIFASHLQGLPVLRVIATHYHPDHVGLADWLCTRWNAPLWMTTGEYAFARLHSAALPGTDDAAMLEHFRRHGITDSTIVGRLQERKSYYPGLVPAVPSSFIRMQSGQQIRIGKLHWQVITGSGHSPEHASLYCAERGLLISGDMLLPRISTNVSVFAIEPEANPVQWYLESLQRFCPLPADTLVLPSHGKPFRGLHARINQLNGHHAARLAEVLNACTSPKSAADIVPIMFARALDAHQLTFALGEALAHLNKLWLAGQLQRKQFSDGVIRFCRP